MVLFHINIYEDNIFPQKDFEFALSERNIVDRDYEKVV